MKKQNSSHSLYCSLPPGKCGVCDTYRWEERIKAKRRLAARLLQRKG